MSDRSFCGAYEEDAAAVIDGVADEAARKRFLAHARECGGCRHAYDDMLAIRDRVGALDGLRPSTGFDARLRERLHVAQARRRTWGWALRLAPVAGVMLAMGIGLLWHGNGDRPPTETGPPPPTVTRGMPEAQPTAPAAHEDIYSHYVSEASFDPFVDRAGIDVEFGLVLAQGRGGIE